MLLLGMLFLSGLAAQAQQRATAYEVCPAVAVRMPLQGDSINFTGKKFTFAELLKTKINLTTEGKTLNRMEADTAGYVSVDKASEEGLFYLLTPVCVPNGLPKVHSMCTHPFVSRSM